VGRLQAYLLASEFLLDPRHLTVALSRAKRKIILVASRTIVRDAQSGRGGLPEFAPVEEPAAADLYDVPAGGA
jgi:hypothetical protein